MNRLLDELCLVYPQFLFLRMKVCDNRSLFIFEVFTSFLFKTHVTSKASDNSIDIDRRTLPILTVYK